MIMIGPEFSLHVFYFLCFAAAWTGCSSLSPPVVVHGCVLCCGAVVGCVRLLCLGVLALVVCCFVCGGAGLRGGVWLLWLLLVSVASLSWLCSWPRSAGMVLIITLAQSARS